MKTSLAHAILATLLWATAGAADPASTGAPLGPRPAKLAPELASTFSRFVAEKRALADAIAQRRKLTVPSQVRDFFAAAQQDDWVATSNLFAGLRGGMYPSSPSLRSFPPLLWGAVHDVFGAYELLEAWSPKFLVQFSSNTVAGIPPGTVYFGGSDAGRFLVSLFSQSHSDGQPFFTLTQNALSDPAYGGYLREMYGGKIYVPGTNDVERCIREYLEDAKTRLDHDAKFPAEPRQVRRGENLQLVGDRVQADGPVAVMAIHARILKIIFDKNPDRRFFLEETYPLESFYPHLKPHQFVFRIERAALAEIPPDALRADREFWTRYTDAWLGPWLNTNTPLREIADFARKTYLASGPNLAPRLNDFRGDPQFVRDPEARQAFAHFRACIAGLYSWRAAHATNPSERRLISTEADFAFRQAFALCPSSPEVLGRFTEFLTANDRSADAVIVMDTARRIAPR